MRITDPRAIRALAHPLRLDLLELLATISPATAAHCGRILGVSQASCSFHLRQLARYGLVEEAGPGRDRRERQWRVPEARATIHIGPDDPRVRRQIETVVVERELQAVLTFVDRTDPDSDQWRRQAGITTAVVRLTVDEAAAVRQGFQALLAPYLTRSAAPSDGPDQRPVRYFLAATPIPATPIPAEPEDPDA